MKTLLASLFSWAALMAQAPSVNVTQQITASSGTFNCAGQTFVDSLGRNGIHMTCGEGTSNPTVVEFSVTTSPVAGASTVGMGVSGANSATVTLTAATPTAGATWQVVASDGKTPVTVGPKPF